MRKIILGILSLFLTSTAFAVAPISPTKAAELVAKDQAVLVDVREKDELKESGLAEPASWLAKSEVDAGSQSYKKFVEQRDKTKTLILYCRSGRRAEAVAQQLEKQGFKTLNMGGFDDWVKAKLPVKKFVETP